MLHLSTLWLTGSLAAILITRYYNKFNVHEAVLTTMSNTTAKFSDPQSIRMYEQSMGTDTMDGCTADCRG